jgi:hypothetical protein
MKSTKDDLPNIGFEQIGTWIINGEGISYKIDEHKKGSLGIDNALYAFALDNEIKYIGKTCKSIQKRFVGYVNPSNTQTTNIKCHKEIQSLLTEGKTVEIWVFAPNIPFQILGFDVNLAAGLEDSLIREFKPEWNGRQTPDDTSDLVEFSEENKPEDQQVIAPGNPAHCFNILLGKTYYNVGFINPGAVASDHLDADGEPVKVFLGNPSNCVNSAINRRANANGSVRVIGNNRQIAEWLQANFKQGDNVSACVIDKQTILLRAPSTHA